MPSVCIDNHRGTFAALEYLVEMGHRRIAFVDGSRLGDLRERREAYSEFMEQRVGTLPEGYIQTAKNSYQGGYEATARLLSLSPPPTAVLAADDTMAIGTLKAAWDMEYVVPDRLSVIGFDDIELAAYLQPALTTVRQPLGEISKRAFELLMGMIREESVTSTLPHILIEPELMIRDSCAPPSS
jgi:DNA-binding LacI/PurR family transcriptional regulator